MEPDERRLLRELAKRVAAEVAKPEQQAKPGLWRAQNALKPVRPLLFISPEGAWEELIPPEALSCRTDQARQIEYGLRMRLYAAEHFMDDQQCDAYYEVQPVVAVTGWGLGPAIQRPEATRGAYAWEAPIQSLQDVELIQTPTAEYDPAATEARLAFFQELFGDLLEVRLHGVYWWGLGLIDEWTFLRGITQTFLDMMDNPALLHAGMHRLMEGKLAWLKSLEAQGVLSLNTGNDYIGSGAFGFTDELPRTKPAGGVELRDMWGFCEAQTMSEVSPAMHEEFILPYQRPILEQFGLNCYGCCEPLHLKLDSLRKNLPRLRRISISPWADKGISAETLGDEVVYNWKPNPAPLAGVHFDAEGVRRDIRETLEICRANNCVVEVVLKDTHTCNRQPQRFDDWARIAREEVDRIASG